MLLLNQNCEHKENQVNNLIIRLPAGRRSDLYLNQRGGNHTRLHCWRFDCFCFSSRWISSGAVGSQQNRGDISSYKRMQLILQRSVLLLLQELIPPPACHQRVIKVCLSFSWSVCGSTPNTNSCPPLYVVSSLSCFPPPVCLCL